MKYCAHFFIGKEFSDVVAKAGKHLFKYGNSDIIPSVNLFLIDNVNDDSLTIRELLASSKATNKLLAGFDKNIEVAWGEESSVLVNDHKAMSAFYEKFIFDKILTINNRGNDSALYVFLHFPIYKAEALNVVKAFYNVIENSGRPSEIDFLGYGDDMAEIIEPGFKILSPSHKQIADFIKFKEERKIPLTRHFVAIQNASQNGITLGLNPDSLSDIIGRFAMLCSEYYDEIFPSTAEYRDVVSFGLSTLYLDKYLFAEYLFNKTVLSTLDNSETNRSEVDVNIACDTANFLLKDKIHVLSDYYAQFAGNTGNTADDFPKVQQNFENEITRIIEKIREIFLNNVSITTKAAILAAVLAKTECELFSKTVFNQDAASFDDLFAEPLDYFIENNNRLEFYQIDGKPIFNPIRELKVTNTKLINSESEIRDLKGQLSSLEKQITDAQNVENCYIEDGYFHFEDTKFRLLPNIAEEPLEETYEAHPVTFKSIDLRQHFNAVKNQGQLGSCLAFSLTSIFEYIIKVNKVRELTKNKSGEIDLSESFLYYNARDVDTTGDVSVNTDTGSRFLPAMQVLKEYGIALEKYWPYNENTFNNKPSEDAYKDALNRRLIKALNVNRQVDEMKSALSDGYPVAISLNLCKSFAEANDGFISLPTEEEIAELLAEDDTNKDKNSRHAMVITGFSDDLQMFVVRNSWGTEWGENGYCYVPYLYVSNEQLCNFSCIITEVETLPVATIEHVPALKVDDTNLNIRYLITKASLGKEVEEFENNRKNRDYLQLYFEKLKKVLSSPNDRDIFITKSKEKLHEEQEAIKIARKARQDEQEEELKKFNQIKKRTIIETIAYVLEFAFLFYLFNYLIRFSSCLFSMDRCSPNWWLVIAAIAITAGIIFYRKILPKTAIISISATLLLFGVSSLVTSIRCDADCSYTVNYLWLVIIYAVLFLIVSVKGSRLWKEWRDKRDETDEIIRKMDLQIAAKEREINNFKIKTFAAWALLKSLEKAQNHFQFLYNNFISLINNLRAWYNEVKDSKEMIELDGITPNTSLLSKDVLDKFFENTLRNDDQLKIDLSEGIENHMITEEYLKSYKDSLFDKIAIALLSCRVLKEFDISAHITDNQFSKIAIEVTRELIDGMDTRSDLFLNISSSERGEIIRSTGIYVPSVNVYKEKLRKKLGKYSEPYFESNDKHRMVFVKTATLWFRECVMLRPG
jgi:C1A family cysteine protease